MLSPFEIVVGAPAYGGAYSVTVLAAALTTKRFAARIEREAHRIVHVR